MQCSGNRGFDAIVHKGKVTAGGIKSRPQSKQADIVGNITRTDY